MLYGCDRSMLKSQLGLVVLHLYRHNRELLVVGKSLAIRQLRDLLTSYGVVSVRVPPVSGPTHSLHTHKPVVSSSSIPPSYIQYPQYNTKQTHTPPFSTSF